MLSLFLACSAVFAVEGTDEGATAATGGTGSVNSGAEDGSKQATALVTLDLSGGENSTNYWEIGFSGTEVKSAVSPTPLTETNLVLSPDAMKAEDDVNKPVYVYWIIKGGQELKISLSASGPLTSTTKDSGETIDWKIDWTDKEGTGQTIGTDSAEETADYSFTKNVHTREKGEDGTMTSGDYGSIQLDISTEDFSNKKAENYQATLILTIADASSN